MDLSLGMAKARLLCSSSSCYGKVKSSDVVA